MKRTFLLGFLLTACGVPADANPALRCDERGTCPADMACHAGFCLSSDALTGEEDAGAAPLPVVDAGSGVMLAPDAAPMPTPPDGGGLPDDDEDEEEDDGEQTTCECRLPEVCMNGMCCSLGQIVCDDKCVDPARDKHHCGACDNECDKGPCKLGICVRSP